MDENLVQIDVYTQQIPPIHKNAIPKIQLAHFPMS